MEVETLQINRLTIQLDFAREGKDSLGAQGTLPVPADTELAGQTVVLDFGGVIRAFTLDAKGMGKLGKSVFKLAKPKNGISSFSLQITGSFKPELMDEGLFASVTTLNTPIAATVLFNSRLLKSNDTLSYTSNKSKGKGSRVTGK